MGMTQDGIVLGKVSMVGNLLEMVSMRTTDIECRSGHTWRVWVHGQREDWHLAWQIKGIHKWRGWYGQQDGGLDLIWSIGGLACIGCGQIEENR